MNAHVLFNSIAEFKQELQKDRDNLAVLDNIVRITKEFAPSRRFPGLGMQHVSVIVTYKTRTNIIKLTSYIGEATPKDNTDVWDSTTRETIQKSDDLTSELDVYVRSLHLEPRAGVFILEKL